MKKILFICLMAFHVLSSYSQTRIIAHRGFWNCDGSAQNSITALKKASQIPVYGSEFDVLMTSDGTLVVNHMTSSARTPSILHLMPASKKRN